MKTFFKIILIFFCIALLQFCNAQEKEYTRFYNSLNPKLQNIAETKSQFYNQEFSKFYNILKDNNITINMFAYDSKMANSKDNYILRIYFTDHKTNSYAIDNNYQFPRISITFKNKIPFEIERLTREYHGEWNNEMFQFFSNMIIEKIDFYGINGVSSADRKAR
ncbi:glycogen synthase [Chryseobacterium sp. H1D6B]|uniref:hypothetical protein n=1 Tax=Chryseobacterium sp. H1D6B TaxID=2940588 RepID=UPI0015CBFD07|nr:hypothetical protein [Chryseobacterium sp. H1D6B]MDH6252878.1 glycogen synthase [Chryseobacterium sp. H1D6B]